MTAATPLPRLAPRAPLMRAPSQADWDALSPGERAALVDALPMSPPDAHEFVPEGDDHVDGAVGTRDTLRMFYQRAGRRMYVGAGVAVFYPEEERFSPDVIAVADVEPHNRSRWVVSAEGKGVDLALEVLVSGDRRKDLQRNVQRYAALGIAEYFVFDRRKRQLHGHRLAGPGLRTYEPLPAQVGRISSQVLGLDLAIVGGRLRFYRGTAMVLFSDEIIHTLEEAVEEMALAREEETLLREDAERRVEEAERARAEEARLRAEAEQRVAELLAELEALRRR
ncbi:MAG: Uma2 family endonuclease [Polyangiales bacterium]